MTIADHLRSTLLSIWLGAALFFSFAVAPNVFATLHAFQLANANEIAGTIVTRTLAFINIGGLIFGLLALAVGSKRSAKGFAFAIQIISLALVVGATTVGHFIVAARMHAFASVDGDHRFSAAERSASRCLHSTTRLFGGIADRRNARLPGRDCNDRS